MKTAEWRQVEELFEKAMEKPPKDRCAFLEQTTTDQTLRREVLSLLASLEKAPDGFLKPGSPDEGDESRIDPLSLVGKSVGRFEITGVIASGGMGTVYEGRQTNPDRIVAIKVLTAWSWLRSGSRSARRRFAFESQILARLSHPHIAQVYEVGTHDEMPYFVMEYVPDAQPITRYATNKKLTTKQRLELMIQVCDAVQHGHQKGVIHRDLKPGNILVDGEGHVKVIDFGVARSTDSDIAVTTMQTDVGQLIGTLQYMSPEQCQADPLGLDVRSDVYSLGVVLYEILCERTPYDVSKTTIAHAARVICEDLPARPSSYRRSLRGDLELIVLKALEKDRERRYQSAADLGRDCQRFQCREPIEAKAPTKWTRVTMWFRRNPIAATSLIAGLIAIGIVGGSIAGVEYARKTPSRVEVGHGNKTVRLIALNEQVLHTWDPTPPATTIDGKSMDAELTGRNTTLALIQYSSRDGGTHRGELCIFDIGGREYDAPLWCDRVYDNDLPDDPDRTLTAGEFVPKKVWALDIYPEFEGKEIIVTFGHDFSRRAIRIYSAAGDRLHQTWHNGAVIAAHFLPLPNLLVMTAIHDTHPWRERGRPGLLGPKSGKPLVVFAFQPTNGDWNSSYLCTDGETDCVKPSWYKCLLPPVEATRIRNVHLVNPLPGLMDGRQIALRLAFMPIDGFPSAHAGWNIDQFGNRAGDDFYKDDSYLLQEDKLPPIESFDLGPLPPIVKPQ
jgi:serine/threonine protein kinase